MASRPGVPDFTARCRVATIVAAALFVTGTALAGDRLRDLQNEYVAIKDQRKARAYHWGSQGPGDVYSNHTSHSNRLIPIYTFGKKADLGSVMGTNSRYRDAKKIKETYGYLPTRTVNPAAEYCDQSDLYRVQKEAIERGAKYLFVVWFDGMDWEATRAAAIARSGKVYRDGKGAGLIFQDYRGAGPAQYGYCVTSPTHEKALLNCDTQSIQFIPTILRGGYDASIAGPNPWTLGPKRAPGYLKGAGANIDDVMGVAAVGGVLHAYTDSSCSAGEFATGVKSYNNGVNIAPDGATVTTLFQQLQGQGWKVGTVTSVPFNHASPAAMYAHNVFRDDYQDLAREMLGLPSIMQQTRKSAPLPGLDVVMGTGFGIMGKLDELRQLQGANVVQGNVYIADDDLSRIDAAHGGRYELALRQPGVDGAAALKAAAERAAKNGQRLFGFYGTPSGHLPFQTADGDFTPAKGIKGVAERYPDDLLRENPTLADMTRSALTVLSAKPGKPFALFVEAGDVDFALHDNNLDNAIGAVFSGDAAIRVLIDWVEKHSNWDESVMIVTADHGHYLVIDDPEALVEASKH